MANIYIASKDVLNVGEHSYWVFDPDDNPYNANERIIRGGNTNTDIFIIDPLEYLIEVDRPIINSRDTLNLYDSSKQNIIGTADPFSDRNYTTVLSGNLDSVQAVWDRMVADARTYGTLVSDPWTSDEGGFINPDTAAYILPETLYGLLSSNCNCFTNTIGFAGGIDFSNHIPLDGGDLGSGVPVEEIQFTGLDGVFLSYGDGVFQFDDRIVSTFDQGGNDTYIYDFANTNTLQTQVIHEDTNIGTFDRIILTNMYLF